MSSTLAPRERSLTGDANHCGTGPMDVVILGGYFSSGVMNPMGRFFGSGGVMSARSATITSLNCAHSGRRRSKLRQAR